MPANTDTISLDLNGPDPQSTLTDYLDLLDTAHVDVSHISVEIEAEGGLGIGAVLPDGPTAEDSPQDESHAATQEATTDGGSEAITPAPSPVGPDYPPADPDPTPDSDPEPSADVDDEPDADDSTTAETSDIQTKPRGSDDADADDADEPPAAEYTQGGLARLNSAGTNDDLRTGVEYWGEVSGIQNYGMFVAVSDNGSVSGLIHRSKFPDHKSLSDYSKGDELVVVVDELTDRGPAMSFASDSDTDTDTDTDSYTDTDTDTDSSSSNSSSKTGVEALGLTRVDQDDEDDDGPMMVGRSEVNSERPSDEQIAHVLEPGRRRYQVACVLARADGWIRAPEVAEQVEGTPWETSASSISGRLLELVEKGLATRRSPDSIRGYEYALVSDVLDAVADAEDRATEEGHYTYADALIAEGDDE